MLHEKKLLTQMRNCLYYKYYNFANKNSRTIKRLLTIPKEKNKQINITKLNSINYEIQKST